ncbi:MAG: ATP-binding protein, partial [Candidatus Nitrosocosmicus sp.]|nr:ATP-binding protein [Candidatus Nitrosocosmicus sp.]
IHCSELLLLFDKIIQGKYENLKDIDKKEIAALLSKDLEDLNKVFAPSFPLYKKYFENEEPAFISPRIKKPTLYIFYPFETYKKYPLHNGILFHTDLPYFPSKYIALNDLMEINIDEPFHSNDRVYPGIIFLLPFAKLYITNMTLVGNNIVIDYYNPTNLKEYGIKIYYESSHYNFKDTIEVDPMIDITLKYIPTSMNLIFYCKDSGEILDKINYESSQVTTNSRIKVITDYRYIEKVIKEHENSQIEFKGFTTYNEISRDQKNKDKFLETVISFANTNGGLIIVGVDDNGNIRGFKDQTPIEQLRTNFVKLIDGNCEPVISFTVELIDMNSQDFVLLLYIQKGFRPPYMRKTNGIYIRVNESDRSCTKTELDDLITNSNLDFTRSLGDL